MELRLYRGTGRADNLVVAGGNFRRHVLFLVAMSFNRRRFYRACNHLQQDHHFSQHVGEILSPRISTGARLRSRQCLRMDALREKLQRIDGEFMSRLADSEPKLPQAYSEADKSSTKMPTSKINVEIPHLSFTIISYFFVLVLVFLMTFAYFTGAIFDRFMFALSVAFYSKIIYSSINIYALIKNYLE